MASKLYPAIIERADGGYRLLFPDLPDCAAVVATLEEAEPAAEEVLADYLEQKARSDEQVPAPSWMGAIGHDPSPNEVAVLLVRAASHSVPPTRLPMKEAA